MGQQRWLDRHRRQSHIQDKDIGGRCPDTLGTLSASFKGAAPTAWAFDAAHLHANPTQRRTSRRGKPWRLLRVNAQRVPRPFFALGKRSGWGWVLRTTSAAFRAARPWSLPAPVSVGSRAMLHREIKPIAHRCARNQVASFSLWVRATGGQAHGHRHRRALLSRSRRHGLAGLGAATGFLVNPLGPSAVSAAALLSLRQRLRLWLGLGLGLGIADGLRQHLA